MILAALFAATLVAPAPSAAQEGPAVAPDAGGSARSALTAGLVAFRSGRLRAARAAFERAVEADPQSASAAYYLGYTLYELAEPRRRMTPDKERARALFAKAWSLDPKFAPSFEADAP